MVYMVVVLSMTTLERKIESLNLMKEIFKAIKAHFYSPACNASSAQTHSRMKVFNGKSS
jgi:hypothetical protein